MFPCYPYAASQASHPICMGRRRQVDWGQPLLSKICWRVWEVVMSDVSKSHWSNKVEVVEHAAQYNTVLYCKLLFISFTLTMKCWLFTHYKKVRFKVWTRFELLNFGWTQNRTCGPVRPIYPNLGPNFGQVQKSSGSNLSSEPNCSSPIAQHSTFPFQSQVAMQELHNWKTESK